MYGREVGKEFQINLVVGSMKFIILCFLLIGYISRAAPNTIASYPRGSGDAVNADITKVTVNGTEVPACSTVMNVGYAHFAFSGKVRVEITSREPIETFDLSPHRRGIEAKAEGNTLSFELSKPADLHIQVNQLPRFFLFASAPETDPPQPGQEGVFDLTKLGVTSDPETVQTGAIQKAIDQVAEKKGVLFVPPGIYRTGELKLKSNLTLHLAAGAVIKGTGQLADHPKGDILGTQFIFFEDCENVRIQGRGVIDGNGRELRLSSKNEYGSRAFLVRSLRARNISIHDVILRDSAAWTVHLVESEDIDVIGCKLIGNTIYDDPDFPWELNTDGFDPDNSSRVLIENCFISTNDDAIAVKLRYGERRDMSDITFRDNVVWTVKSALKVGTEVYEKKLSKVRFENNDVIHADRGIVVYLYRGADVSDISWVGNHFEFIGGDAKEMNLVFQIRDVEGRGKMRDLLIKDNTFERFSKNLSEMTGLDDEHEINGVVFENLVIHGQKRLNAKDAEIEVKAHVDGITFR